MVEVPVSSAAWSLGSQPCAQCGRRCYLLLVASVDGPMQDDLRAVVDLLGITA
jgi:hypothetical protein